MPSPVRHGMPGQGPSTNHFKQRDRSKGAGRRADDNLGLGQSAMPSREAHHGDFESEGNGDQSCRAVCE